MPLLPGHPPTFITSICLSASSAVSPNASRDAHICHISIERLSLLNLHTLEQRRLFADLIMCYYILKDNNCINPSTFFSFPNYKFSRGHPLKISIPLNQTKFQEVFLCKSCHPRLEFFVRNNVMAPSTVSFKHHLHHTDFSKFRIFPPAIM